MEEQKTKNLKNSEPQGNDETNKNKRMKNWKNN